MVIITGQLGIPHCHMPNECFFSVGSLLICHIHYDHYLNVING